MLKPALWRSPPAIDWRSIADDLAGVLQASDIQVGQMKDPFDDADGTIADALEASESALDNYFAACRRT